MRTAGSIKAIAPSGQRQTCSAFCNLQSITASKIDFSSAFRNNEAMKSSLFFLAILIAALICAPCAAAPSADISAESVSQEAGSIQQAAQKMPQEPEGLAILRRAYPDVSFDAVYNDALSDWKITVSVPDGDSARVQELYWCDGRMIPEEELANRNEYWQLMYRYNNETPDPADFTEEDIERIRQFSSPENRRNGASSPQFFYDLLYDCTSRERVERHIVKITFLGKQSNVHSRIVSVLKKVEEEILAAAETDSEVRDFVQTLASADSYNWREIRDSGNRSFHSIGIAIDVLPRGWGSKNIYWSWRRDVDPDNWMLLPLEQRWMPPDKVRDIFERNGFIWGGNWIIWDNMHFEYRPEVILFAEQEADLEG